MNFKEDPIGLHILDITFYIHIFSLWDLKRVSSSSIALQTFVLGICLQLKFSIISIFFIFNMSNTFKIFIDFQYVNLKPTLY